MKLLTYKDVAAMTGLTVTALTKRRERGQFPEPDLAPTGQGPGRAVYWYEDTIRAWVQAEKDGTK